MDKLFGMDRYDRNARLSPALITLLPVFLFVFVWFQEVWTISGAVTSLIVASGILYALTRLVRRLGHRVEQKLGERVGTLHTARLLSLTDDRLSAHMKKRCRSFIEAKSGVPLPSKEQEVNDARSADEARLVAIKWLLNYTRSKSSETLLLDENISYGFARNLFGLKPLGLAISGLVCVGSIWFLANTDPGSSTFLMGIALCGASFLAFLLWLFLVTESSVERASQLYAEKILSLCLENPDANR